MVLSLWLCGEGPKCFDQATVCTKKGNSEGNTARGLLAGTTFSGQYNFCDLEIFPFNSGLMGKKKYWAMTESDIQ